MTVFAPIISLAEFLEPIHEGAFEQPLWQTFLHRLRVATQSIYTTLIFRPIGETTSVELYAGENLPPRLADIYHEKYKRDPVVRRDMQDGRVYSLEELLDPSDPLQFSYLKDMMEPLAASNLYCMRVTEPSGVDAWLSCYVNHGFGDAERRLMADLAPHLRIALRNFIALERERFRFSVTSDAFRRMNFGWFTLDERCRIVDATAHVEQQFQQSRVLRRGRFNRLVPESAEVDRELTALVKQFAENPQTRPKAINLCRDPWIDILVTATQDRLARVGSNAVAVVFLSGDVSSQADRCGQLVELFDLLPSEARLAWALAQGLSFTEAADELGLTVETVRNYSKKIYAKTGARGRAELVRTILTSVLALA